MHVENYIENRIEKLYYNSNNVQQETNNYIYL
jgi:hypothetical protein